MALQELPYSRNKAVAYAHRWASFRNPDYCVCRGAGGDSANFASQCVYAGSDVMNYSSAYGWFYISPSDRSASWAGAAGLYHFLVSNDGAGPYGYSTDRQGVLAGDLVQLATPATRTAALFPAIRLPPCVLSTSKRCAP